MQNDQHYHLIFSIAILIYLLAGGLAVFYYARYGSAYKAGVFDIPERVGNRAEVVGFPVGGSAENEPAVSEDIPAEEALPPEQEASSPSEETAEPYGESEASSLPEAGQDRHYYRLKTITTTKVLHLRTGPSLSAEIIYRMPPGTPGYVLHRGEYWSYIVAETANGIQLGFAANKYLSFEEIAPEEVPEEYRDWPIPGLEESPIPANA